MGTHSSPSPTILASAVRNTVGREKETSQGNLNGPISDASLREYCDKHYNQLLPILAEKTHQEKVQQEKLKTVKARLNFEEVSQHSDVFESPEPRCGRSESPRKRGLKRETVFKRLEKGVFHMLGDKENSMSAYSNDSRHQSYYNSHRDTESCYQSSRSKRMEPTPKKHHSRRASSRKTEATSESKDSAGGHWKSRSRRQRSNIENEDLSQPWVCEETDPFTPRIRYFDLSKKTRMPNCHTPPRRKREAQRERESSQHIDVYIEKIKHV
ncbi:hypothetical protein Tco_0561825 [Tanacetum coccineum]